MCCLQFAQSVKICAAVGRSSGADCPVREAVRGRAAAAAMRSAALQQRTHCCLF